MIKQVIGKITIIIAGTGFGIGMMSSNSVIAANFVFNLEDDFGESILNGTFAGEDLNSDNTLQLNELTAFDIPSDFIPLSIGDLSSFDYVLGTSDLIAFTGDRRIDINNEEVLSREYSYNIDGFRRSSAFGGFEYLQDGTVLAFDSFSEQPPQVSLSPVSTPEPSGAIALGLFAALLVSQKKSISS